MSTIGKRPSLDRILGRLDTGAIGRALSPERSGGGRQSPTLPTPESPLKRRNALRVAGGMAGRVGLAAFRGVLGAARDLQAARPDPNPTPTPMAMPMPQPWCNPRPAVPPRPPLPPKPPELWPTPLEAHQNPRPAVPPLPPKPPELQQQPLQMPAAPSMPNPWDRPAVQWQQPAPQGFPQRPGPALGQQVDAYPIQTKVPQGQQKLFRQEQRQATNVPTLARHLGRLYKQLNLKVTGDTLPAFTNAQVLEPPKKLGSGAFNTVFSVKLKNPDGTAFDGVFKPLGTTEKGWVAAATGIPPDDPQIAMRNIATVGVAKKLGFDVVPSTRMAVIDTGRGAVDPDLGLVMERARGKPAAEIGASTLARGVVAAEITKLQLLDHITGQGDRHANNYFIDFKPEPHPHGTAKVMGIDNDQCFGKNLTDPAGIQQMPNDRMRHGFRGTGLPPVVDTEMARSINSLTSRDIRAMLGNKLSEPEIQAAIARHEGVKNHIAKLRTEGNVIHPGDWEQAGVRAQLTAENSYIGRERHHANHNW
jgi:hypothetical protein